MEYRDLCARWPVATPTQIVPLTGGTNNNVLRVETADGQTYVLRLQQSLARVDFLHYEARLLYALQQQQLSFQLPVPLKTYTGEVVVIVEDAEQPFIATLYALLPGHIPDRNHPTLASASGVALAELDIALARLKDMQPAENETAYSYYGNFAAIHPLVPDPLAALEKLPITPEQGAFCRRLLENALQNVQDLYKRLPQQLLHRDYGPGNIFVDGQRVTAILDFEFAGVDIRILELAIALCWWPSRLLGTGKEWEIIDAFGLAYTHRFPLSDEELAALPATLRLRDMTSFVHRIGRYFAGLENDEVIASLMRGTVKRENWLLANEETLLAHALAWKNM